MNAVVGHGARAMAQRRRNVARSGVGICVDCPAAARPGNKRCDSCMVAHLRRGHSAGAGRRPAKEFVSFHPMQADRKLSPVDMLDNTTDRLRPTPRAPYCCSTYVSIEATCPETCRFKRVGCFVRAGFTGKMMKQLDAAARNVKPSKVICAEAQAIHRFASRKVPQDGACGGRDMRLHVGGDVTCEDDARELARAALYFIEQGGQPPWTYTHRWREIPREAWVPISVLASVETVEEAVEARALGYVPAFTMTAFQDKRAFIVAGDAGERVKVVPCPAETGRGVTCVSCRLCLNSDRLHRLGVAIGFELHGGAKRKAARLLPVLRGEARGPA